jgi:hypothetical protein
LIKGVEKIYSDNRRRKGHEVRASPMIGNERFTMLWK